MSARIETTAAPVLTETATPAAKRPRRTAAVMQEQAAAVVKFLSTGIKRTKKEIQEATGQTDKEIEASLIKLSREKKIVASGTRGSTWILAAHAKETSMDEKFAAIHEATVPETELIAGTPEGDAALLDLSASANG